MNNLTDINYLKNFLRSTGLKPKDWMGQNFLVDEVVLQAIIQAADLNFGDTVLEVGPGLGVLTNELVKKSGRVLAVEKDRRFYEILAARLTFNGSAARIGKRLKSEVPDDAGRRTIRAALPNNLKLINQDILRFDLAKEISGDYKVVANIPYYLTSKLFQYFLEQKNKPKLLVLMVQKEVGERIVASPGQLSILGLSVQIFADVKIELNVSKDSFWPKPKVNSVILRIEPQNKYPQIKDQKLFFRIVKSAFAGKRKQIHNTLASNLKIPKERVWKILAEAKIKFSARPQDLSIEDWIKLYSQVQGRS